MYPVNSLACFGIKLGAFKLSLAIKTYIFQDISFKILSGLLARIHLKQIKIYYTLLQSNKSLLVMKNNAAQIQETSTK